jgi:short-subunit dehydrogenase
VKKAGSKAGKSRPAALITGASSGIGWALADQFARHGHDVILVARNEARLSELAQQLRTQHGIAASFLSCDLSRPDAADEIHRWIRKQGYSVDILVNNAGFDVYGKLSETDRQQELDMLAVNVVSLTALTKLFLPRMIKRERGRILNIGSTGSFIPSPRNAVYSASKAYVLSFSAALAEECRGSGVSVSCVCPGATHTNFHERALMQDINLMKIGVMRADYVAGIAYRACMSGRRLVIPGPFNKLSMATMAILPLSWQARLAGFFTAPAKRRKTS